jgi:hypothetical protein
MKVEILPPRIPPPVTFESLVRYEYFDFAGDICQKIGDFSYIFVRYPEDLQAATLGLMVQKLKPETFRFERV